MKFEDYEMYKREQVNDDCAKMKIPEGWIYFFYEYDQSPDVTPPNPNYPHLELRLKSTQFVPFNKE